MSKWSSFNNQQLLHEGWRRYLSEDTEPSGGGVLKEFAGADKAVMTLARFILKAVQDGNSKASDRLALVMAWASPLKREGNRGPITAGDGILTSMMGVLEENWTTENEYPELQSAQPAVVASLYPMALKVLESIKNPPRSLTRQGVVFSLARAVNQAKLMLIANHSLEDVIAHFRDEVKSVNSPVIGSGLSLKLIQDFQKDIKSTHRQDAADDIEEFDPMSLKEENK